MSTQPVLHGSPRQGPPPLVSILIVVYQSAPELRALLDNLRTRDLSHAEVIVIDAASTDATVEILESEPLVDLWLSEPDHGIYDAMNKAIHHARGHFLLHLNAGDTLDHIPSETLTQCLAEGVDVATFAVLIDGVRVFRPRTGLRTRIENTWHHQGTFYRRQSHLLYDPVYRVYGDLDHNLRLARTGASIRLFPNEIVSAHSTGGASSISNRTPAIHEVWRTVRQNSGLLYVPIAYLKLHAYLLLKKLRR